MLLESAKKLGFPVAQPYFTMFPELFPDQFTDGFRVSIEDALADFLTSGPSVAALPGGGGDSGDRSTACLPAPPHSPTSPAVLSASADDKSSPATPGKHTREADSTAPAGPSSQASPAGAARLSSPHGRRRSLSSEGSDWVIVNGQGRTQKDISH